MQTKVELVLHPVRMRILQILIGREMSTREIAELMRDVPPATLYRHVRSLVRGNVITVVAERRVRGAVERVYAVSVDHAQIGEEDLRTLSRDEHMRMFVSFVVSVIGGFERYLTQERIDLVDDGVSYRQATLHLDDSELKQFVGELGAVVRRASVRRPSRSRRQRIVSTIIVPEPRKDRTQ